jgi:hypothetical protein
LDLFVRRQDLEGVDLIKEALASLMEERKSRHEKRGGSVKRVEIKSKWRQWQED